MTASLRSVTSHKTTARASSRTGVRTATQLGKRATIQPGRRATTATQPGKTAAPQPKKTGVIFRPTQQVTTRESFNNRGEWITQAHCRAIDPEELFVRGAAQRKAVAICRHCPVVLQCRADALDNNVEFGVWGGMTERQRRALLRQHPEITSWADFFAGQLETNSAQQASQQAAQEAAR